MRLLQVLALLGLCSFAVARANRIGERSIPQPFKGAREAHGMPKNQRRSAGTILPQNHNTTKFKVDGTAIPDVHFDIGESYAGLLPISQKANESRQLYFWFFPSSNPKASDEILIWLNGGPGCSSLEGLFQENGPFTWMFGTWEPVPNPYTWVNLTNVVWVEQPVGTGFSQGKPTATNEVEVAKEFIGFWKNFIDTFGLHNRKVFVTGESYAGYYVPYIANQMYEENDKTYYGVDSILIYDPSTSSSAVQNQIPAVPFVQYHHNLFNLNSSYMDYLIAQDRACGYAAFREKYFVYPPPGILPTPPGAQGNGPCDVNTAIYNAATVVNPCFDVYQVATTCPLLIDPLGFPGSFPYKSPGFGRVYFNRDEVKKAINAPMVFWQECAGGVLNTDTSPPSGLSILPGLIEKNQRTVIGHGTLDYVLIANGTLLMIQNMTWNGKQGFQSRPSDPFYVPYHSELSLSSLAGAGQMGITHHERGLTWVETWLSGHMEPQYAPSASYRHLEFLLGRIPSLSYVSDFTTQTGNFGN